MVVNSVLNFAYISIEHLATISCLLLILLDCGISCILLPLLLLLFFGGGGGVGGGRRRIRMPQRPENIVLVGLLQLAK